LQRHLVDLDHDTVDLVLDVVAVLAPVGDVVEHLGRPAAHHGVLRDRQAPHPQRVVGL